MMRADYRGGLEHKIELIAHRLMLTGCELTTQLVAMKNYG